MDDAPTCGQDWSTVTGLAMGGQPAAPAVAKPTSTAAYVVNPIIGQPAPEPPKITSTSVSPKPTAASTTSEPALQAVSSLVAAMASQRAKVAGVSKRADPSSFTAQAPHAVFIGIAPN